MNKIALALGTFDGLHRGHINVLNQVKKLADDGFVPSMLMFDCHPQTVLRGYSPPLLITREDKEKFVRRMGIEPVEVIFRDIAELSPDEFVRDIIVDKLNTGAVVCGENFRFGKGGAGDSQMLKELCSRYGVRYIQAQGVYFECELISATRIRRALENGEAEKANAMLGRNFSYDFLVVEGNKIGKKIFGFPTINQHFPKDFINLRHGVYASQSYVDGVLYPSVTNFGSHPTVGGDDVLSETCILGFDGDLYYRRIKVEILKFLRSEKRFDTREQLKEQIEIDSKTAVEIFNSQNKERIG